MHQPKHSGLQLLLKDLNAAYKNISALHYFDNNDCGFEWLDVDNNNYSILAFMRKGEEGMSPSIVVVNLTPTPHYGYSVKVPESGYYKECLNTDSAQYGGSNVGNDGGVQVDKESCDLIITLPPLATLIFEKTK